jgi:hypothetical protein
MLDGTRLNPSLDVLASTPSTCYGVIHQPQMYRAGCKRRSGFLYVKQIDGQMSPGLAGSLP